MDRRLAVVLAVTLGASAAWAQAPADSLTLSDPAFLKVPEGLGEIVVAKAPPTVYAHVFKDLPNGGKGTLWSGWGNGCIASNGKYYTAMGDHLDLAGGNGQSRIYEFDPATKALQMVVNMRDIIPDTTLAGGKVHARLQEAADGWLYFTTYWGKVPRATDWDAGFQGSALLRYDPRAGKAECLGVPVPQQGLPTSLMDAKRGLIYFYAVYSGDLVVYDLTKREVRYRGSGDIQTGGRNIIADLDGNVYFGTKDGHLARYSPDSGKVTITAAVLPSRGGAAASEEGEDEGGPKAAKGGKGAKSGKTSEEGGSKRGDVLRASTRPARDGTVYAMTSPGMLFAFAPKRETIKDLGPNFLQGDYTAIVLLSPDEKYLYYAPGSHGSAQRHGAALVQYEIATGKRKVLAFLAPLLREKLAYVLGGTFNMEITADGATLIGTFNGAPYDPAARKTVAFGQPSLLVIQIPPSER